MRSSKYLFSILKFYNKNDHIHEIMIKSGLIRKLCSGLYSWLPTGKKIIDKLIFFIKKEMNKINAMEISIPILQPDNIWKKSNRINLFKNELMITYNKNKKFILSPTNEEIITYIIKNEIYSNKQLPIILFQIQNKFRNEIRPRGGIIRTKEFLMNDSYSFHNSKKSLEKTYNIFKNLYKKILNKFKLNHYIVKANSEFMGGNISHEFHVPSNYGEDSIIICKKTNKAEIFKNSKKIYNNHRLISKENIKCVSFNNYSYNEYINKFIKKDKLIKVYICHANKNVINNNFIALVIKFNDFLCKDKIKKLSQIYHPIKFANSEEIYKIFGFNIEYIGIFNLKIPMIIDYNVALMSDFITGNNIKNNFIFGVNWGKDINFNEISDISNNNEKKDSLIIKKSIEIAHIFKLNNTYSKKLNFLINNNNNKKKYILMASYGIGISRILFSIIENNIDNYGIKFPSIISPFDIAILPININSIIVKKMSEKLYIKFKKFNLDILLDDRHNINFSSMFKDLNLLGIPIILIISEKKLLLNLIEVKYRYKDKIFKIEINKIINYIVKNIKIYKNNL